MNTVERTYLKGELAKMGIKGDYLDSWQPRGPMWRHKPQLNISGNEVQPAGIEIPNQPLLWDHQLRMAVRIGALPWKPSKDCGCKLCRERDWSKVTVNEEGHIHLIVEKESPVGNSDAFESFQTKSINQCPDCDFVVKSDSKNPVGSLRFHRMGKHRET